MTFLPIPNYEWLYSFDTTTWQIWSEWNKRFLVPRSHRWYKSVILCKWGKWKRYKTHRIVATLFLPFVSWKDHINHIDGNKWNDTLKNLEWCTPAENVHHSIHVLGNNPRGGGKWTEEMKQKARQPKSEATKNKMRKPKWLWWKDDPRRKEIKDRFSKKVYGYTLQKELVYTFNSVTEAFKSTGIPKSSICNCASWYRKHGGGFLWSYGWHSS